MKKGFDFVYLKVSKVLYHKQITKGIPMDSIQDLTPEIQKRISDFEHFLEKEGLKRPEVKFTGAILTSMLKEHHVHLTVLARGLEEKMAGRGVSSSDQAGL